MMMMMARTSTSSVAAVLLLAWSWWTYHQTLLTIIFFMPTIRSISATNIRDQFTMTFYDRCYNKYEFIRDYIDIVDSKPERYLEFVYDEDGLINGGIGDRSAGVISAFLHAIRFRRSMNLYADNNMHKLFRPFHPRFIPDPRTVKETEKISPEEDYFLWENWGNWSGYESFKQRSGKDLPGFGLTCHFTIIPREPYDNMCGLVDVPEENIDAISFIRMTSNRCYLCRFFNRDDLTNHEKVMRALKIPEESKEEANLFEIGGCIMRLFMWPREFLWSLVDEFYSSRLKEEEPLLGVSSDATTIGRGELSVPFTLREAPPFQMALQYRCGDEPSFQFVAQQSACFDFDNLEVEASLELPRSNFFLAGRPLELGRCLLALADYLRELRDQDRRGELSASELHEFDSSRFFHFPSLYNLSDQSVAIPRKLLVYITSDSTVVENQLLEFLSPLSSNNTGEDAVIVSGEPCHIDVTPTDDCYQKTAVSWFVLALSQIIVTQVEEFDLRAPLSSFSRYAGLYGLQPDSPFRAGHPCGETSFSTEIMFRVAQGNWFCD